MERFGMWFSKNVDFGPALKISRWRKISISSWRTTRDSTIVSILDLDVEPALAYLAELQKKTHVKLTMTHFAGYVLALVFAKFPETNVMVRRGRLYPRKSVDLCFLVASGRGDGQIKEDLTGHLVRDADRAGVLKIAADLTPEAKLIKAGDEKSFRGIKQNIGYFPDWVRQLLVNAADFIMHTLNLWSPILGFQRGSFGTAMLTSVGSLGIEFAIPRIYPQSRNVMMVSVGASRQRPVVRDGKVVVGHQLRMVFAADHRVVDGIHAALMLREFQTCFEHPETLPNC